MRNLLVAVLLASCPLAQSPTWVPHPTNGREYALSTPGSWDSAEAQAVSFGGHLATVRTPGENTWLSQTFAATRWIGLSDSANEGQWVWASGEATVFVNWDAGQPDSNGGNEDYACMHAAGVWHDDQSAAYQGIMERERATPTWVLSPVNGHYYALSGILNWTQAEQRAVSLGGHLVVQHAFCNSPVGA